MLVILCAIVVILSLAYKLFSPEYDYFEKKGIPFSKPRFLVGSRSDLILRNKSMLDVMKDFYDEFRNDKVSGIFEFNSPIYLIRDPQLIKQLTVTEFDHFVDHKYLLDANPDSLVSRAIFSLRGQKWRGSKMRQMFELLNVVGQQVVKILKDRIKNDGEDSFEFRELARKFTVDAIATCALGIEVNSFENPKNIFHETALKMAKSFVSLLSMIKFAGYLLAPKLMLKLQIQLLPKDTTQFFKEAMTEILNVREQQGIVRPDLVNLLIQAKKGKLSYDEKENEKVVDGFVDGFEESNVGKRTVVNTKWEDDDLIAQCFIFFFAGFDSVSSMISLMAYELMLHPDIQKKLQNEIDELCESVDGKQVNYEQIQGMKYMDQVVCETLRKWSAPVIDRLCNKDIELEYDGKKLTIEKGKSFYVPVAGIHYDERYYANPDTFDPERFSEENREKIQPGTYLPFGMGPRNCIGSRFAIMELKTMIYYLLLNFHFEPMEKTQIPLKLTWNLVTLPPEKGIWVGFRPRN